MDLHGQPHPQAHSSRPLDADSPILVMSPNVNGPVDPLEFYVPFHSPTPSELDEEGAPMESPVMGSAAHQHTPFARPSSRTASSAAAAHSRSFSAEFRVPGAFTQELARPDIATTMSASTNTSTRHPSGNVKDMAHKFDRDEAILPIPTSRERYGRPSLDGRGYTTGTAVQKKRSGQVRSPRKAPSMSFDSTFSTVKSKGSQSQLRKPTQYGGATKPLFGEITSDGKWNGNFDIYDPVSSKAQRRGSEGSLALGHGRSLSHQDIYRHSLQQASSPKLNHKRSRSDKDETGGSGSRLRAPSTSNLSVTGESNRSLRSSPSHNMLRTPGQHTSRIPIRSRQPSYDSSNDSNTQSRSPSAMSNPSNRSHLPKSPSYTRIPGGKENTTPSSAGRSRYNLPQLSPSQTLSAKIVAPLPKTSPPLRSSRPRQPVNAATTSASRARAADRFGAPSSTDRRRPSEQWLGKPYDAQTERTRRRIPELDKIDFEERRARIQRAISQNLDTARSLEQMRSKSRSSQSRSESRASSRMASYGQGENLEQLPPAAEAAAEVEESPIDPHVSRNPIHVPQVPAEPSTRGLSLDTSGLPDASAHDPDPLTSHTVFEDDSPITEENPAGSAPNTPTAASAPAADENLLLLTPATYQPPTRLGGNSKTVPATQESVASKRLSAPESQVDEATHAQTPSAEVPGTFGERIGAGFAEDSPTVQQSLDQWALGNGAGDQGSIRIMLDEEPSFAQHPQLWSQADAVDLRTQPQPQPQPLTTLDQHAGTDIEAATSTATTDPTPDSSHAFTASEQYIDSHHPQPPPLSSDIHNDTGAPEPPQSTPTPTPRKRQRDTLKAPAFHPDSAYVPSANDSSSTEEDSTIARVLHHYQSTGSLTGEMLQEMQQHVVDLNRLSANGESNAFMVQNLLESILGGGAMRSSPLQSQQEQHHDDIVRQEISFNEPYNLPLVTPDTPTGEHFEPGTVVVFNNDLPTQHEEEEDFEAKIRRADAEWERQQRGEAASDWPSAADQTPPPPPPPKDYGYTPRSSMGPNSAALVPPPNFHEGGLRISTSAPSEVPRSLATGGLASQENLGAPSSAAPLSATSSQQQLPISPLSPIEPVLRQPFSAPDFAVAAMAAPTPDELSPGAQKAPWAASNSSRPSFDSQRAATAVPSSQSMTSFGDATTQRESVDDDKDKLSKTTSPNAAPAAMTPEQKRLSKRRHIIKELIDTENTYHQDLKIIEDIYKATCTPELVAPEDKKVLFGNCDEVEKFALHFYDEMRKAVTQVYVPSKSQRWGGAGARRNSMSTTQSDATTNAFTDAVDDEKDRTTLIGKVFIANMVRMEQIYGTYLKNHDAANQRLVSLQGTVTVKCWLDECHANASDITSAWDLDSLLVKPTQRVAKYPMLLQQLLETTPADHPDHENLKTAAGDSIAMLTRINDAKKRADLVDSIVNGRRRKESDLRGGLVKAFGRRTDRLKERVGLQEAFQDPEFDDLSHKFGGHFIRLQICMRDVQDYMNRTDKAVELINNYASALELFTDVSPSSLPEIESKWRRYGQTIRDLNFVAFTEHKTAVQKRVLAPMIACIKLHDGPQNAIIKRKKRIVDYAKRLADEKRGIKSDKKTIEAAEVYVALNDQLKIELPKLYSLTAALVQNCLHCFLDIQLQWNSTWERKLRPLLEAAEIPTDIAQIEAAFKAEYGEHERRCMELSICNGSLRAEANATISYAPTPSSMDHGSSSADHRRRTSTLDGSKRNMSVGSESSSANAHSRRHSGIYSPGLDPPPGHDHRLRSDSQASGRYQPYGNSANLGGRTWSNTNVGNTPNSSFSTSRPGTANQQQQHHQQQQQYQTVQMQRQSSEQPRSPRPMSVGTAYYTPRIDATANADNQRFSGIFSSAMPPPDHAAASLSAHHGHYPPTGHYGGPSSSQEEQPRSPSPAKAAPSGMPVLFVCASLFEFSIDKTRREGGYPYLTYVQGEVFDVIAQKGELWLAKNQDDPGNSLGWIWEQHFVILSSES